MHFKGSNTTIKGVRLLHENAVIHTIGVRQDTIRVYSFQQFDHLSYGPDIAPSNYYLVVNLKEDLRGRHFQDDEEVTYFEEKPNKCFYGYCIAVETL